MMRIRSFWFFVFQKRIRPGVGAEERREKKSKKKKSPPSNASK
jgi:hypothetical protein